jgi:hypothetical protein
MSEQPLSDCDPRPEALSASILDRYRAVVRASREKAGDLRFGRRTVAISTIAQQFYCEKAVQFGCERPLPPTRSMIDGTAGHEVVASLGVPMTHEEAVAQAVIEREAPLCIYEFRIGWEHEGVTVTGLVDEAWFRGGAIELVAERKFSGNPGIHRPYMVQAALYCLGLGAMGFSTRNTRYRISVFERGCHECPELASGDCPVLAGRSSTAAECAGAGHSELFSFDREQTTRDLDWALQFWRNEREAEPTTSPGRCRACRYRTVCDAAGP